jgi:molybdenum cofactor cytidylyltransferase
MVSATDPGPEGPAPERLVAILLAAGAGSRFTGSGHKLEALIEGVPVVVHALEAARAAGIGPIVVVRGAERLPQIEPGAERLPQIEPGAERLPQIEPGAERLPQVQHVVLVDNPDWEAGQITSLRAGLRAAEQLGADAAVVGLGDQPFIDPSAWQAVAASTAPIAVATYDGERGHPVRLHRSVWHLLPHEGDQGARSVLAMHPELVEEIACQGASTDIDTVEDLRTWQSN